ncbi:MAG: response regulator transcription factor [Bacteroidetes bacterium]|nr:response regulator transcription factor [Bacteroidota bacterium]MBS1670440.1 response regulator transcription factor [Bacteroidota bacterium]
MINKSIAKYKITPKEWEVLKHLPTGKLNKEIAHELGISIETVKKHLQSGYKKIKVRNRAEAIIWLLKEGHET